MSTDSIKGFLALALMAFPSLFDNTISIQVVGVHMLGVLGAALGAAAAVGADTEPRPGWGKVLGKALSWMIIGCFLGGVLPWYLEWESYDQRLEGAICGLLTFFGYLFGTSLIKRAKIKVESGDLSVLIPERVRKVFRSEEK